MVQEDIICLSKPYINLYCVIYYMTKYECKISWERYKLEFLNVTFLISNLLFYGSFSKILQIINIAMLMVLTSFSFKISIKVKEILQKEYLR